MGNKLCPKVILEGIRLTFKTEIAFELNDHPRIVALDGFSNWLDKTVILEREFIK
jgi:hypothetical protein